MTFRARLARPTAYAGSTYAQLIASLGAVSYWPLQGAVTTDTIGGRNLTFSGSPTDAQGPGNGGGSLGLAADFDFNNNQWGSVASTSALQPTTAVSAVCWYYARTLALDRGIVSCSNTSSAGYCLRASGSTTLSFQVRNGASVATVTTASDVVTGTWTFVMGVYDKTNVKIARNGTSFATSAGTFDIAYSGQSFYIGNWDGNTTRDWDGRICGVALFNVALSATDGANLYQAGLLG